MDVPDLVTRAREGDPRAVARLISLVEDASSHLREVSIELAPYVGRAHIVGLTGSPGVGKSTTTSAVVAAFRQQGKRVGVLAVDPSSPFSGGALLGDRVRMQDHALDPDVYIRSMASRGHLGGLAWATPQALRVLDGAGCDVIVLETVGVGQSEVEVVGVADTVVVLLAPGMGDGIQAAKAGILEIGDIFVVNKADRDGADATAREVRHMIGLGERELVAAVEKHEVWARESGAGVLRRQLRAAEEIEAIAMAQLRGRLVSHQARLDELALQVAGGALDPYAAADVLVAQAGLAS